MMTIRDYQEMRTVMAEQTAVPMCREYIEHPIGKSLSPNRLQHEAR
jgi:hypothetical protein